jgi:hypothetical protein
MTPTERGERASKLMADQVMIEAFSDIRMALVTRLESLPIGDIDTQHEIALMLQLLKQVRTKLEMYGQDVVVDKAKQRHTDFIQRMKRSITA